jgi:hypothetical protein
MNDGPLLSTDDLNPNRARLHYHHKGGGISFITRNCLSFNEGGGVFNFHLSWRHRFWYVYLAGHRLHNGSVR